MKGINQENLILESEVFERTEIERQMADGGFNSIAKFELFIWDLEMFLKIKQPDLFALETEKESLKLRVRG